MKRNPVETLLVAGFVFLAPADILADSEVERRVAAHPAGLVTIENIAGSVAVRGWDRDEVEVVGRLGSGIKELAVDNSGKVTDIEVVLERHGGGRGHGGNARLEIRVPRLSALDIEVVSAEVEIVGVGGEVTVESVSGSIDFEGDSDSLDLESVSGSIEAEGEFDRLDLETVSGQILARGSVEEIEAGSVSGSIEIISTTLHRAELSTTSGSIEIEASLSSRSEIEIESHSGSVDLRLPISTSAEFEIETYSGRIDNAFGPSGKRTGRYGPGRELDFTLGRGDAQVDIETFSGSVALLKN